MSYDFTIDGYDDPGPNVLDNGLPALPQELPVDHGVAVARWIDGDFGVVMAVYRQVPDDEDDEADEYGYDVQPYVRVDGAWQSTNGSGGSGWFDPPFRRPSGLAPFAVSSGHMHQESGDRGTIRVVDGVAGEDVVSIEVQTDGRTVRMPIESPIGAWVVGVTGDAPAQWVARDKDGRVAASGEIDDAQFGMPSWLHEQMKQHQTPAGTGDEWMTQGIWMVEEASLSPDAAAWFARQANAGRIPGETYIESDIALEWQRLAHDLQETTVHELMIRAYPHHGVPEFIDYEVWFDGERHGALGSAFDTSDAEVFLAEFADQLCEQYLHELVWGGWPTCPVHNTHPLDPVVERGVASWVCPKGALPAVRIGGLTREIFQEERKL